MKLIKIFSFLFVLMLFSNCHREDILQYKQEPVKSIAGTWKIIGATRNGTDLINRFDFSHFKITFTDSSYTIDSLVPFIVTQNGKYHLDDPQYPFKIYFETQDNSSKELDLKYPSTNGVRNIVLTFSPGCSSNSYTYTLQKVN
ncbi:hypothetical protein A9P82_10305 [Arachidicoccus ginsenosidimutans]|uniref:DUF5004 domain-containing protein n=1 Tax=Arachidicoccus sp. BS20 TaxID=1850526 RepID=UPI0007F1261A|nr:DUF5004 domain-containing protein [Arachidicoccus sp. BS20]ANI89644.1 hypothetical protein A9P82_10305 [Arachidicoccus sp. BS20]